MIASRQQKRKPTTPPGIDGHVTDSAGSNDSSISRIRRGGHKIFRMLSGKGRQPNRPGAKIPAVEHQSRPSGYGETESCMSLAQVLSANSQLSQGRSGQNSDRTIATSAKEIYPLHDSLASHDAAILSAQGLPSPPKLMASTRHCLLEQDVIATQPHQTYSSTTNLLSGDPSALFIAPESPDNTSPMDGFEEEDMSYRNLYVDRQEAPRSLTYLDRAQSTPSIPLSQKISTVFFAPTVRRRPNKAAPPNVNHLQHEPISRTRGPQGKALRIVPPATPPGTPSKALGLLGASPLTSTPILSLGDSLSPVNYQRSTPLTSPLSDERKWRHNIPSYPWDPALIEEDDITTAMPVNGKHAHPHIANTVALVERAAAAKVFFETYYHGPQFESLTPRSLRRRKMEVSLYMTRKTPSEQREIREYFVKAESEHLREIRAFKSRKSNNTKTVTEGASIGGYDMVRVIGKGSFGVVSLVRERQTEESNGRTRSATAKGTVYAMKVIQKSNMLRNCQEGHLRAERDFLVSCAENSKWVVPLVASFQDTDNLYLVMEFEIGGDFLQLLFTAKDGILPEDWAQWYVAEMILCVEEAHRLSWIHRDVKPDNFLISASGHLKISDFGLAFDGHWAHTQAYYNQHRYSLMEKLGVQIAGDREDRKKAAMSRKIRDIPSIRGPEDAIYGQSRMDEPRFMHRRLAASVVGTSQYMAPEVVQGLPYDGRCDWWSIGIILYECLFGTTPFLRDDRHETKRAICHHASEFRWYSRPLPTSPQARDIICRLLSEKEIRLCSKKYFQNDFKRDIRGCFVYARDDDKMSMDFPGKCVFSDDAEDIKRHPFFAGIPWDHMHLTEPPHVPRFKRADETKYFESEERILADFSTVDETGVDGKAKPQPLRHIGSLVMDPVMDAELEREREKKRQKKKASRRPRDKLLRDPAVAKTVMAARKKGAFLGYTYRRPKTWSLGDELRLAHMQMPFGYDGYDEYAGYGAYDGFDRHEGVERWYD